MLITREEQEKLVDKFITEKDPTLDEIGAFITGIGATITMIDVKLKAEKEQSKDQ